MRRKAQGDTNGPLAVVTFDRAQQTAQLLRIQYRGAMLDLGRDQRATQVKGYVPLRPPGSDGIAEDRTVRAPEPDCRLIMALCFHLAQNLEQVRRSDLRDRSVAQFLRGDPKEPGHLFDRAPGTALQLQPPQPLVANNPKGLFLLRLGFALGFPAVIHRIDAPGEQLAGLVTSKSSGKGNKRIWTERECSLFSVETAVHSPEA